MIDQICGADHRDRHRDGARRAGGDGHAGGAGAGRPRRCGAGALPAILRVHARLLRGRATGRGPGDAHGAPVAPGGAGVVRPGGGRRAGAGPPGGAGRAGERDPGDRDGGVGLGW